jgi:hypothetical protein
MLRCESRSHCPAENGSWNVSVCLMTPVESVTWACARPTPAWGRIAGTDEVPVAREREECLVDVRIVGRVRETGPHVEVGRTDDLGIADVDVSDDAYLPRARAVVDRGAVGAWQRRRWIGVTNEFGVVLHALLDEARERREHEGAVDAQLVHELEPRRRLTERRDASHRLAEDLGERFPLRVAASELLLLGAGTGDEVERRVGDVLSAITPCISGVCAPTISVSTVPNAMAFISDPERRELGRRGPRHRAAAPCRATPSGGYRAVILWEAGA